MTISEERARRLARASCFTCYDSSYACRACNGVERYVSNGTCVACSQNRTKRNGMYYSRVESRDNYEEAVDEFKDYYLGKLCSICHNDRRWVSSRRCTVCNPRKGTRPKVVRETPRSIAVVLGKTIYKGKSCKRCGCSTRYVANRSCMECTNRGKS